MAEMKCRHRRDPLTCTLCEEAKRKRLALFSAEVTRRREALAAWKARRIAQRREE